MRRKMSEGLDSGSHRRLRLNPDAVLWLLLLLLVAERIYLFSELGADYMTHSDDDAYLDAGLYFARTGTISMWGPYPSAMIMPGMPVLIGAFSLLFGGGTDLKIALKLLWIAMGVLNAYVCYLTVSMRAGKWAGLAAMALFLIPNMAWMTHALMTETPYMLFFSLCVYYTLRMEQSDERRWFLGYGLSFFAALMFRSNIVTMPLFTAIYLLLRKRRPLLLLRRGLALLAAVLLFVIPWGIRNYHQFGAFIPLSYGVGNPLLRGTYQGEGFPEDEELDYETYVDKPMQELYGSFYREEPTPWAADSSDYYVFGKPNYYIETYDPEGVVKDLKMAQYLSLQADEIKAHYRLRTWWEKDPKGFLKSFLVIKPRWMLNWSWAWEQVMGVSYDVLHRLSQWNFVLCGATVLASLLRRKHRAAVLFLTGLYFALVYIHALAFVTDRYASTLMVLRFMILGFGLGLALEDVQRIFRRKKANPA